MVAHINKNTKTVDGVICDLCSSVLVDKFEYYSARVDLVEVDRSFAKQGIKDVDRRNLDLDLCIGCMDELKKKILEQIAKRAKQEEQAQQKPNWTTKP